MKRVAVVGAGTVGLSTALKAIEVLGDKITVTVIADSFLQQTTSYGSGGLWEPYQIAGTSDEKVNGWGKVSFDHFMQEYHGPNAAKAGVQLLTSYQLLEQGQDLTAPSWKDIVFNFSELDRKELDKMGIPAKYVKGFQFGTFVIEQKYYMQFLTNKLKNLGVSFQQRKLNSLNDLANDKFDCIINCCGLGASVVVNDKEMYPIRGQVLRVKAPWLKSVWFFGTSYIIPNVDTVVLGGTAQKGNWDTTVSLEDSETILNNISQLFPSIRDAPLEYAWAGLRPGRSPLRLESEEIRLANKPTRVIHCYGHGGSGITIAMGCADDVVRNYLQPHIDHSGNADKLSTWIKHRSRL